MFFTNDPMVMSPTSNKNNEPFPLSPVERKFVEDSMHFKFYGHPVEVIKRFDPIVQSFCSYCNDLVKTFGRTEEAFKHVAQDAEVFAMNLDGDVDTINRLAAETCYVRDVFLRHLKADIQKEEEAKKRKQPLEL